MLREEKLAQLAVFEDKPNLLEQVLMLELQTGDYLPNQFETVQTAGYHLAEKFIQLGRVGSFYYLGIRGERETEFRTQAFHGPENIKSFFVHLPDMEQKLLAFWLNEVERVS
ncbi:DUF3964 family protein [Listeria costaricensis]|uniref:DUF3964 family protein n=1 Tax=Listeria costaricensis TaxID=2026604 RepID=UPI000C089219|nr:DUF3964 family protein [Listeria costaricensis]